MTAEKEAAGIMEELAILREMLQKNEQMFNFAEDDELTEALIYERQSLLLRYSAAVKRAKKLGISAE